METAACHGPAKADPDAVEALLDDLGVKNVARWAEVSEGAVWQAMSRLRRGDADHFTPAWVPKIYAGARAEGKTFDPAILWPAMRAFA